MSAIKITSKVTESTQATSVTETLLNIIPTNIFESLANGTMLQIILFALILGVILANMSDRVDIVKNFFSQFNDIMMEMTMAVMKLAPIGVFCLISKTFAEIGFDVFIPLLKYMFCVLLALGVQCFGVYMSMLKIFSGLNPIIFIKNFFPVMAFAFSTSTSNATIPMNIDTLAEKMGVSKKISSFTIPLKTSNQYGWRHPLAKNRCGCLPQLKLLDSSIYDGLCNSYWNSNACFNRNSRGTKCWINYTYHGL